MEIPMEDMAVISMCLVCLAGDYPLLFPGLLGFGHMLSYFLIPLYKLASSFDLVIWKLRWKGTRGWGNWKKRDINIILTHSFIALL